MNIVARKEEKDRIIKQAQGLVSNAFIRGEIKITQKRRGRIPGVSDHKLAPGAAREYKSWRGQYCDCGNKAVHYFAGPECQRCWDARLFTEQMMIDYVDHTPKRVPKKKNWTEVSNT